MISFLLKQVRSRRYLAVTSPSLKRTMDLLCSITQPSCNILRINNKFANALRKYSKNPRSAPNEESTGNENIVIENEKVPVELKRGKTFVQEKEIAKYNTNKVDIKFLNTDTEVPFKLQPFRTKRPSLSSIERLKNRITSFRPNCKLKVPKRIYGISIKNKILNKTKILIKNKEVQNYNTIKSRQRNLRRINHQKKNTKDDVSKNLNLDLII